MAITLKNRKTVYTILFVSIILLQLLLFYLWTEKNNNEQKLEAAFAEKNKASLSLDYFDNAVYHFFDAESQFNSYLQDYDPKYLKEYRSSILDMSRYLDSLQNLISNDSRLQLYVRKKQKTQDTVLVLKKKLDQLINRQILPLSADYKTQASLSKATDKEIKSLHYEIIRMSNNIKKKRLLSRIIDAIRNKEDYNKEEVIVYLSKAFGTRVTGNKDDDVANLFLATDKFYANQFNTLKSAYKNLKDKDRELIWANRRIIDNCREIIARYRGTLKKIDRLNDAGYHQENVKQGRIIYALLLLMLLLTFALLLYTWHAYDYGKKLAGAKAEIEHNLEFKNRLIGMLSHEMKAPLNIISNFSEKIKHKNQDKALDETVDSLLFTSNSLQLTVNQILNFFKKENGELVLYKSEVNLQDEINSIVNSLKSLADAKKLQFIVNTDQNLGINVLADNGKIHQLFYNIIGNAIKFTDKGAISLTVKALPQKGKIKFEVRVKDTGIGIPPDDLAHIFDEYYQSNNSFNKTSLGAGLGLNLCKEIINLHDGGIDVKSEMGNGTEVSFYLLLDKATDKKQSYKNRLIQHAENQSVKVAFVDDDLVAASVLKKLLTDIRFEPVAFHSANEIKSYLGKNTVGLVITDLDISGYSGLDLITEIRQSGNANSSAPIIVITGNDYMQSLEKEVADEVIIKPIDREEFYAKLYKTLKSKRKTN